MTSCGLPRVSRRSERPNYTLHLTRATRAALVALATVSSLELGAQPPALARTTWIASYDSVVSAVTRTWVDTAFVRGPWQRAADSLRPRALAAATLADHRRSIEALLSTVPASHFHLIPAEAVDAGGAEGGGGAADAGLELRLAEGEVVAWRVARDGPGARAGLRPGDAMLRIGSLDVGAMLRRIAALPGEGERQRAHTLALSTAMGALRGDEGSAVTAVVSSRDDLQDPRTVQLTRRLDDVPLLQFGSLPPFPVRITREVHTVRGGNGGRVRAGVIAFGVWLPPIAAAFDRAVDGVRGCEGLVLDLRGNPGGIAGMMMGIAGHVLDSALSLGVMTSRAGELRFAVNPRRVTADGRRVEPFGGPVAILVDGASASTSEIFAGALQSLGRSRIFGERTAGQALLAVTTRLPSRDILMHATADIVGPDGSRLEGIGVLPDEVTPLVRRDLRAGVDATLDAALRWIAGESPVAASGTCEGDMSS